MKKYREFVGINALVFIIGCFFMGVGAMWSVLNFFDVWDVILTRKELLIYNWKPITMLLIGFALFTISVNRAKLL